MTSILKLIEDRRSVRKYQDKPVEPEKINALLEAARMAPSACNAQPWEYVVFTDKEAKNKFCETVFTGIYSSTKFAAAAPVIIAVISNKGNWSSRVGNIVCQTSFYLIDQGISTGYLTLAAQEQGLGTCYIGWFDHKKAAKFLNLGNGQKVELLLSAGYPAESPAPRPRKTAREVIFHNKYKQ
ncbi:MAG: nitroreductase family protein [Elusimicrobium sp.]|jgi:nitroreductase|nr:nitroreductase family protein [Elusimicrobium sp.]